MNKARATDADGDQRPRDAAKMRACLRCSAEFMSQWAGERICPNCKRSGTWRSGMPFRPPTRGARR